MWLAPAQLGSIIMHHAPEHSQRHSSAVNQTVACKLCNGFPY